MKKTNHILMMAALFLTGALSVGCSEADDNDVNTPNPTADRVITVTGTVHFGDNGSTRSSLGDDGKKSFKEGDEMAVRYKQIGATTTTAKATFTNVTADGATFTVQLVNPMSGKVNYYYPYSAYTTQGFDYQGLLTKQKGTKADVEANWDWCMARDITITVDDTNVTLADATLHNFLTLVDIEKVVDAVASTTDITNTITMLTILLKSQYETDKLYTISPSYPATTLSGPIWVALDIPAGLYSVTVTAYTNQNKYYAKTLPSLLNATVNQLYKASKLTLTAPQLGDLFYSDGTYSSTLEDGKTPIGVIAYLGNDVYTEKGTNLSTTGLELFNGHGLVLSLKNALTDVIWSTDYQQQAYAGNAYVNETEDLTRDTGVSGYLATKTMAEADDAATIYPAARAASTYTPKAPNGTTGWFLPSAQQWVKMIEGLGEFSVCNITFNSYFDNSCSVVNKWEAALAKAGTAGTDYDRMNTGQLPYWSSSEFNYASAVYLYVRVTDDANDVNRCLLFTADSKETTATTKPIVRPVFAF